MISGFSNFSFFSFFQTATTGYIQHKLVKGTENLKLANDGTVRTSGERIVEFDYGGDGFDASRLCRVVFQWWKVPDSDIARHTSSEHEHKQILALRHKLRTDRMNLYYPEPSPLAYVPFHPDRVLVVGARCPKVSVPLPHQKLYTWLQRLIFDVCTAPEGGDLAGVEYILRCSFCTTVLADMRVGLLGLTTMRESVMKAMNRAYAESGEMVGLLAAESTGEPTTQMSFTGDTAVLLNEVDTTHVCLLGPWIEEKIERAPASCLNHVDLTTVVDLSLSDVTVPSVDPKGNIEWRPVTHATRHPPNGELIKVTTRRGREIKATLAKSFLVIRDGSIEPISGSDLCIGDVLPLTSHLPHQVKQEYLDLRKTFPSSEWRSGSEMTNRPPGGEAITPTKPTKNNVDRCRKNPLSPPHIFPCGVKNRCQRTPGRILLDEDFGFFVGAYLSEGHGEKHFVTITNQDPAFRARVERFVARLGLTYNVKTSHHGWGTTIDIDISSMVLATLMGDICGTISSKKRVPDCAYDAPLPFIVNLLDGYFSGEGSVRDKGREISARSSSHALLEGIGSLLNIFGCSSHLCRRGMTATGNPTYMLSMYAQDATCFGTHIPLTHTTKELQIAAMLQRKARPCASNHKRLGDVCNDEIVSLERFVSKELWVYDLTIPETLNFGLANGIHVRDTLNT